MSGGAGGAESDALVGYYEQLRSDALSLPAGRAPAPGLALFLRKGMTAWMRAWPGHRPQPVPQTAPLPGPVPSCSVDIGTQIATILAGIILGREWEVARES